MSRREIVRGEWPKGGVTFRTIRGSFVIPADVLARAEITDDDVEIRALFAERLPRGARTARREKLPGGDVRVHWRRIFVVPL